MFRYVVLTRSKAGLSIDAWNANRLRKWDSNEQNLDDTV